MVECVSRSDKEVGSPTSFLCGVCWKKFGLFTEKIPTLIFSPPPAAAGRNSPKIAAGRAKIPSPKTLSFLPARLYPLRGRAADI